MSPPRWRARRIWWSGDRHV